MGKRILVILGHPSADSLCGAISDTYAEAARTAGHEVKVIHLGNLAFDPILHDGYARIQDLEPDLIEAQAAIKWAEHLSVIYPIWWGSVPALLKGFLDRMFLPGFAFKFRPGSAFPEQLLQGRSAHLLVTMDTPPWYFKWVYRMPGLHQMQKTTLEFCGIRPVKTFTFGPVVGSTPSRRSSWLDKARLLASRI
ncbi:MAG: NAD(P)H-dependent oxidoreductase [Glaciimonas sp.]|nr:NAD(P)H-dependent oxidoreductase [Glaciimonas sp.]